MALYEYLCGKCGHQFEKRMPMANVRQRVACPKCRKQAKKLMATFAVTGRADEGFDFDATPPDLGGMPGLPGGDEGGHDHGHSHGGHSHDHGADSFGL